MGEAERLWIDILQRKHEYGPAFGDTVPTEVVHEGERFTILIPDLFDEPVQLEIRGTVKSDNLFILIAHLTFAVEDYRHERGILMVAKNVGERTYAVHVWHELFVPTLGLLGLDQPKPSGGE